MSGTGGVAPPGSARRSRRCWRPRRVPLRPGIARRAAQARREHRADHRLPHAAGDGRGRHGRHAAHRHRRIGVPPLLRAPPPSPGVPQLRRHRRGRGREVEQWAASRRRARLHRRQPHHRDLRHLRRLRATADRELSASASRMSAPLASTSRTSVRNASSVRPGAGKVVAQQHVRGSSPASRFAHRDFTVADASRPAHVPSASCCVSATRSRGLVNGRSQARIWVSDTSSRPSAMAPPATTPACRRGWTVSAPSASSSTVAAAPRRVPLRAARPAALVTHSPSRTGGCAWRTVARRPTGRGGRSPATASPGRCIRRRPPATA